MGCEFVGRGFVCICVFISQLRLHFASRRRREGKTHATDAQTKTITKITKDFEVVEISNVEINRLV